MKVRALCIATAAALFALSANAQRQPSGAASGESSGAVPGSSQSYPAGSTATPSGHSPGQGAGTSGSATTDFHRDAGPGMGHGASGGASAMGFSQMDRDNNGVISRDEWNAMHGGSSGSAGESRPATRSAPEPSTHAPAQ